MRYYVLIFFSAIIFQACSNPEKQTETSDSTATRVSEEVSVDTTSTLFKGFYIYGNEVSTFQDCGTRKTYWVNDSIVSLRTSYDKTNRFPAYPYESVYAEVKGYLSGKSKLGYASEYDNVLVVTDIVKVEAKNFRTDCYNYEFIVLGNEPFWSIEIIPEERRIVFKEAGLEKVTEFPYAAARVSEGVHRYEVSNPKNDKLSLNIRAEKCSDGMSDRVYNYSAEVTINGKIYKGCAIKKGDVFPNQE